MARVCLLTGLPGTGKTTIIRKAISQSHLRAGGFYTEEIRVAGKRQGFSIVTLDGQYAVLAHVDSPGPNRVSKYGVDILQLDTIGVAALYRAIDGDDVVVIDEIGKMELFSLQFRKAVQTALDSGKKVLGTIMSAPSSFTDNIKLHSAVEILNVTRENRNQVLREVLEWLNTSDENNAQINRHA
jgi:nucleoside-triphosphatase